MKTRTCFVLIRTLLLTLTLLTLDLNAGEYWVTADPALTDNTGSGTAASPWVRKTASGFDALMNGSSIPADSKIHLMAGTFLTLQGITPKSGWKIVGAGMDATVVKLDVLASPITNAWPVIGGNGNGAGNYHYYANVNYPKDNVEVSDFTVDLNVQNQTSAVISAAVGLAGNNSRISRIKVINWGSTGQGESFLIGIWTHPANDLKRNAIIDSCIIGPPAQATHVDGVTAIMISGCPDAVGGAPGAGWIEGGEIRNCFVKDIVCDPSGGIGKPTYFHAFCAAGVGMRVRNNIALNLGPANTDATGTYMEGGSYLDYVVENNTYLNVSKGIYFQGFLSNNSSDPTLIRRNIYFRNNVFTVKSGGYGIEFSGYPGGTSGGNKPKNVDFKDNDIHAATAGDPITGIYVATADNVTIENNRLDASSGIVVGSEAAPKVENNRESNGSSASISGVAAYSTENHERNFTPSSAGWYRLLTECNVSAGTFRIHGAFDGKATDLEFTYDIPYEAVHGNITIIRNLVYPGPNGGHISKVRISNDPYTYCKLNYVDIYLPSVTTAAPLRVEWKPGPESIGLWAPASVTYLGASAPSAEYERVLEVGRGFRSSGPIYAGSATTQITDDTGKILNTALDANLTTIAGLDKSGGKLVLANGSAWTSTAISGDGTLSGGGALTVNKLTPNDNPLQGFTSGSLNANITLTANSNRIQHLKTDSATVSREITLGSLAAGREFIIHNIGTAGSETNLVIKNAGGVLFELRPGWFTFAVSKGSGAWEFQTGSKNQPFTVSITDIDAKVTGARPLLTVPTGLKFYATSVTFDYGTRTGTVTTYPAVSFGDASVNNSIYQSITLVASHAPGTYSCVSPKSAAKVLTAGEVLSFWVNTAAAGTSLTYQLNAHVTGFYR